MQGMNSLTMPATPWRQDATVIGLVGGAHWVARLDGLARIAPGERVRLHAPRDAVLAFAEPVDG